MANLSITITFDSHESDLLRDHHEDVSDLSTFYKEEIIDALEYHANSRAKAWREDKDIPGKVIKDYLKSPGYKNAKDRKS